MQAKRSLENDSAIEVSLGGSVVVEIDFIDGIDAIVGIDFLWRCFGRQRYPLCKMKTLASQRASSLIEDYLYV